MKQARLVVDGRPYDVRIDTDDDGRRIVHVAGRPFRIDGIARSTATSGLVVQVDGVPHTVERLDLWTVRTDDVTSHLRIDEVSSADATGAIGAAGARIHPPMPGKVVAVHVRPGAHVAAGDVLLILEAMKMQNEVRSPAAGVVLEVAVDAGRTVDTKDVLMVLGPPDAKAPTASEPLRPRTDAT